MKLYIEKPKVSTQKVLDLIHEFSKVAEYKINIQKSVSFLHYNEVSERESKKKIHLKLCPKKVTRNKLNQGGERTICSKL